jgi:hypothetical protein
MASAALNHDTGASGLNENAARKQIKVDSSRQTNILRIKARKAKVSGMEKKKNNTFCVLCALGNIFLSHTEAILL